MGVRGGVQFRVWKHLNFAVFISIVSVIAAEVVIHVVLSLSLQFISIITIIITIIIIGDT